MDILKNENIKNAAAVLWHKFLLAETVNDIILSEIKDRLYLQNVDEDWLMSPETSPRDTLWHVSRTLPSAMSWKKQLPRSMKTKRPSSLTQISPKQKIPAVYTI